MQKQIFYKFFWRLIDGHFENGPIQVTWCDTSPHLTSGKKSEICSILLWATI